MKTITMVIFLFLVSLFPLSTKAQAPVPPKIYQPVTVGEVRQFLDEFKARYMKMDLEAFMGLFSQRRLLKIGCCLLCGHP